MNILTRVWGTVSEPRHVTILSVASYVAYTIIGIVYVFSPSTVGFPILPVDWVAIAAVVLLLTGGAVGAQACWRGVWSIEAAAAMGCSGGVLLAGLDTISRLTLNHSVNVYLLFLVGGLTTLATLAGLTRLAFVWGRPDSPKDGVTLPADLARALYVRLLSDGETDPAPGL